MEEIRAAVGAEERVICALSGGVDSSVMALLVHRALGDRLRAACETVVLVRIMALIATAGMLTAIAAPHAALGIAGFAWLAVGGLFYTVGIVFYVLDRRMKHAHGIWHLFVIAGSAAHYGAILFYVL